MHRSLDRAALEQQAIAAQSLYIAAVVEAERLRHEVRHATRDVTALDVLIAESERDRRFVALRDLLRTLGYVPRGFTAGLPPEPGGNVRRRDRGRGKPRHV